MEVSTRSSVVNRTFMYTSLMLPRGCSALTRADGLPLRCTGQSLLSKNPIGVCLTREEEVHPTDTHWHAHTHTYTCCHEPEGCYFFPKQAHLVFSRVSITPGVRHPGLDHFTDGRADVGCGLYAVGFWLHDLVFVWEKIQNVENIFLPASY